MMVPPKVTGSTIAVHRRGSVNVSVHPEKDSLLAMAMAVFSPCDADQFRAGLLRRHWRDCHSGCDGSECRRDALLGAQPCDAVLAGGDSTPGQVVGDESVSECE